MNPSFKNMATTMLSALMFMTLPACSADADANKPAEQTAAPESSITTEGEAPLACSCNGVVICTSTGARLRYCNIVDHNNALRTCNRVCDDGRCVDTGCI